jgi:hypothetical protein
VVAALAIGAIVATRDGPGQTTADTGRESSAAGGAAPSSLTAADAAGATTTAAGPGSTVAASATTAAAGGTPPAAVSGVPDLGPVDGADQLRAALAAAAGSADDQLARTSCPVPAPDTGLVAVARWRGQDALVFASTTPPTRAVVLASDSCELLAEVPLG